MVTDIEVRIINELINRYERSKTFNGENKTKQTFKISPSKMFRQYDDDAAYEFYQRINESITFLESKNFVTTHKQRSGKINSVILNTDGDILNEAYSFVNRIPRKTAFAALSNLLDNCDCSNDIMKNFVKEQKDRIKNNKNIDQFNGDLSDYKDILKGVAAVVANEDEVFIRDFSVRLYGDSKRFEQLQSAIVAILCRYGENDDRENVLAEYGIVRTPTYVCIKGCGVIDFGGQMLDLSVLGSDIALSTQTLKSIRSVKATGDRIVTIENLTTFHDYNAPNDFVIYLGGFHNTVKRDFICLLYKYNPDKTYLHFGDIDVGGFHILVHLQQRTGVLFAPFRMDIATLKANNNRTKSLTQSDKARLEKMLNDAKFAEFAPVLEYMMKNNCKLEQEGVIE